jgi:Putative zinc- or iron-chelating domain
MPPENQHDTPNISHDLRQDVAEGLLYTHSRLNANTSKTLEAASFLYALIELLSERGLIAVEELDERKRVVGQRLAKQFSDKGMGVMLQEPEYDKYTFQGGVKIDCENRIHLCKAACCRLPFALSKQDVREGIVRWDLGQPYLIDQGKDGSCVHLERGSCQCSIYAHRPVPCRGYDCRNDGRIWLDFEKKLPNPAIDRPDWPQCVTTGEGQGSEP